jgi:hypothetical protein
MNTIFGFIQAHPTSSTLVAYYIAISFVGSLPAPQAASSMFYQFVFKFVNTLAGNLARAYSSKVEASPNFAAAVNIQNAKMGEQKVVVPLSPEEAKP